MRWLGLVLVLLAAGPSAGAPVQAVRPAAGPSSPASRPLTLPTLDPAAAAALPAALPGDDRPFGVELEYALSPSPASGKAADMPAAAYVGALRLLSPHVSALYPRLGSYEKYGTDHSMAQAVDFDGRDWQAVPEEVDGRFYDGVEVVTPALSAPRDEQRLMQAHEAILASGRYRRGISSSMHLTFDVSDLIDADGNAARLVDAMLFIESHWAQIYAAISPVRYGTMVNEFASPLSADHPRLFQELASMPRKRRTLQAVKDLFLRYQAAEESAQGGYPTKAWKMRSANYAKMLGLWPYKESPAIEFRIADLGGPEELRKARRFFAALLAAVPPQNEFRPSLPESRAFADLNAAIAGQDLEAYGAFVRRLRLDPADYPALAGLGPLPKDADSEQVAVAALKAAAQATLPGGLPAGLKNAARAEELIDALLGSSDERQRLLGARALDSRPDEEAVPRALRLMSSRDVDLRRGAFELLTRRPAQERAWPAMKAALMDPEPAVRSAAVFAVAAWGERAVPVFQRLWDHPDEKTRHWIRYFLEGWGAEVPREQGNWLSRLFR